MKIDFNTPILDFEGNQIIIDNTKVVEGIEKKVSESKLTLGFCCRQALNFNVKEDNDTSETIYQKGKLINDITISMVDNKVLDLKAESIAIIKKALHNFVKLNGYSNYVAFQILNIIDK